MAKTATVRARIEPDLKAEVDEVLEELGLTWTQLVTLLAKQVQVSRSLPFEVKVPNKATQKAMEDAANHRNLESFASAEDLFASWDEA